MRVNFFLGLLLSIESSAVIVYQFQLLTFTNVSCSILSLAPLSMESCIAKVNRSHWYLPSGEICAAFEIGVVGLRTGFAKQLIPARTTRSAQPWRGYSTGSFIRPWTAQPGKQDSRWQFSKGMYSLRSTKGGM